MADSSKVRCPKQDNVEQTSPVNGHAGEANGKPVLQDLPAEDERKKLSVRLAGFPQTDLGNAERFIERCGHIIRYCEAWKKWLIWSGRRWEINKESKIYDRAKFTVRQIRKEANTLADKQQYLALVNWEVRSESKDKIKALIDLASKDTRIQTDPSEMDSDPWLFNCTNGTIDLRAGKLRPHRREDLITKICKVPYLPDALCPQWENTLALFLPDVELVGYVQRVCGRMLAGVIRENILPVAFGDGANGKSTIFGTLLHVFGTDYAMKTSRDFLMSKHFESHPTEMMDLFGKRFVLSVETEKNKTLNETLVKELTGNDVIRGRRMRENTWEFTPTHSLILATNNKPEIQGTDYAIWRRVKLLPFSVVVSDKQAIFDMSDRLTNEYPGILAWLVSGFQAWHERGLEEPACVSNETSKYKDEQDRLPDFLEDTVELNPGKRVKANALYVEYASWTKQAGMIPMSETSFGLAMEKKGYCKHRSNGIWYLNMLLR
jgi:putative DNA primase/helicase